MIRDKDIKTWDDIRVGFGSYMDASDDEWREYYYHRPIEYIQNFFFTYDTEELLVLYPAILEPLREALQRDDDGNFKYHTVVWSWMKKSAKSTIIAAVCDWYAMTKFKASIKLIGNDLKQADSRVGMYMRENIKIGQRKLMGSDAPYAEEVFAARKNTRIKISGYTITYPAGSKVEMIPVDPTGEAGGNDDLIIFSELWGWRHKAHQDMWAEMTISPTRYGKAQRWVDTYAGFLGKSPILEQLYETIVRNGVQIPFEHNREVYTAKGMLATWVTKPQLPWQTKAYYDSERATLTDGQFRRLHRNQWVNDEDSFIDIDWWDDSADTRHPSEGGIPPLRPDEPIIIALDAGITSDCFAMVAISRDPRHPSTFTNKDGEYYTSAQERFVKRYSMSWQGSKKAPLRFYSDDPDKVTPESEIKRLVAKYNVIQVTYDPYQLIDFCNRMGDETEVWFDPFAQGGERELGDKLLYDIIRKNGLAHAGLDDDLRTHLLNAGAKVLSDDRKLRIVKQHSDLKVDLVVAMAMATKRASDEIMK